MKNIRRLTQMSILIILLFMVVLSLVIPISTNEEYNDMEVSAIIRGDDTLGWSNMRQGMEQAAYDLGVTLRYLNVSSGDYMEQLDVFESEVNGGADGVILMPIDAGKSTLETVEKYSTPVIFIETDINDNYTYVSPSNEEIGRQMAEICQNSDDILLINTFEENDGLNERLTTCFNSLREQGKNVYMTSISTSGIASDIDRIIAISQADTIVTFEHSATEALANIDFNDELNIFGVGNTTFLLDALYEEKIDILLVWNDYALGYHAMNSMVSEIKNEPIGDTSLNIIVVKKEDIYDKETEKILFPIVS